MTETEENRKRKHLYNTPLLSGFRLYDWPKIPVIHAMGNPKTMQERLVDSLIVATIAFFSTLAPLGFPPTQHHAYASGLAFLLTFFSQLAYERGIHRYDEAKAEE